MNSLLNELLFRKASDIAALREIYHLKFVIILQGLIKVKMHDYYDAYANKL